MQNNSEIQLIEDCLKGVQSAFKALYELYRGYVYTICIRYGISAIEVKDCMQTIFMEIFKSLDTYDPEKSAFKTWLSRVAINQILSQKRRQKINFSTLDSDEMNVVESSFSIPIESQMDEKTMHEILRKMPTKYSAVFNLFIIDEYSHAEIADMLNITVGKSRILLHRGRVWAMQEFKKFFKDSMHSILKANNI